MGSRVSLRSNDETLPENLFSVSVDRIQGGDHMSVSLAPQDPWIQNAACERTFRTLRTLVCALMSSGDDIRLHDSDIEQQLFSQFMWMYSHDDLGEKQRKIENIYSKEQTGIRHTDTKNKSHTSLVLIFKYVLSLESPFCGRYNAFSESGYCIVFSLFFIENHSRKTRERGSCFQYSLLKS